MYNVLVGSVSWALVSKMQEIADGHVWITFRRPNCIISMSSINSEGGRSGMHRWTSPSDRSTKISNKLKEKSGNESSKSKQRALVALFKRIQSSIAASDTSKETRPKGLREKQSAESINKAPHKHPTENQEREQGSSQTHWSRSLFEKKQEIQNKEDFTLSKSVSTFVDSSSIHPVSSAEKEHDFDVAQNTSQNTSTVDSKQLERIDELKLSESLAQNISTIDSKQLQRFDELKLPELKELAKSKGVKGYSKLTKKELIELLKGMSQA